MIDIVFSDSACGSLKIAQNYGKGRYIGGTMGIFISHSDGSITTKEEIENARIKAMEKEKHDWERAKPMGGDASNIYGFNLMLSVGDISENQPDIKRKQILKDLYSVYPHDEEGKVAEEIIRRANIDLKLIREKVISEKSIRIWYSNNPDEMCGIYWFMTQFNKWNIPEIEINIVKLPEWELDSEGNVEKKDSWSEVAPGEWYKYRSLQKTVSLGFVMECELHWRKLQAENTSLRAIINGQLVSVQENLYDDFIFREILLEDIEFQEAMIVGRVLGKYRLGVSDSWVAFRIDKMIKKGKLEMVTTSEKDLPSYHRLLKRQK